LNKSTFATGLGDPIYTELKSSDGTIDLWRA